MKNTVTINGVQLTREQVEAATKELNAPEPVILSNKTHAGKLVRRYGSNSAACLVMSEYVSATAGTSNTFASDTLKVTYLEGNRRNGYVYAVDPADYFELVNRKVFTTLDS